MQPRQPLQNSSQRGGENQPEKLSSLLAIKLKFRRKRKKEGGKKEEKNERKKRRRGENFSTSLRVPPFPCGNRGKRVKFEFPEMKTVTARRDPHWIQRRLTLRLETTILKIEYLFNNYHIQNCGIQCLFRYIQHAIFKHAMFGILLRAIK